MLIEYTFIFCFSLFSLFLLRKIAQRVGLVDKPNLRKQHKGAVPLVGGIAIFMTLALTIVIHPDLIPHSGLFLACIAILIILGVIDDKFDISFKIRLVVQSLLTIAMITGSGLELNQIGNIFGVGSISMHALTPFITIFAVIGAINAFNMVDGIDGLLGGLAMITFSSIAIILNLQGQQLLSQFCIVMVIAILPYVLMNLGLLGRKRKVFMGDAGSMMIGFTVIWLLLTVTQGPLHSIEQNPLMRPVTALWIIAIPLMDMVAIMIRRIRRGRSPFKPDRDHLHHICQRNGLSKLKTLFCICGLSAVSAAIGVVGEVYLVPESIMFVGFMIGLTVYTALLTRHWPKHISQLMNQTPLNNQVVEQTPLTKMVVDRTHP
ncbi:UDP-N-acetylglucosamine--undecaprenyl-phosphate N-acetylglucosaminephosphotransferase [Glaciecola sp.]|nr:UDP-N-acetylglucosamine--undecaprenyl-phosphate N-acetylglucosaminephosphotransferase [Glaciecola sp.]